MNTIATLSDSSWQSSATGPIRIPLTNDYLFRAMLQRNNHVLKGLISSLLGLPLSDIKSVVITNPIILGTSIDDKTFFLDVAITLNDDALINLEMQVLNEYNWPERSLSYLCRSYDQLNTGEYYQSAKPAIQIGLLDFTLFPEHPEFYATYKLMNVKDHTVYSDKLRLSVLNLTRIDLATKEDIESGLTHWAALFKSTTWEELKMLAKNDEFMNEASATIYTLSQEENIRLQCEARDDYYRRQRSVLARIDDLDAKIADKNEQLSLREQELASKDEQLASKEALLVSKDEQLASKEALLASKDEQLASQDEQLASKDEQLASKVEQLASKEELLASKD